MKRPDCGTMGISVDMHTVCQELLIILKQKKKRAINTTQLYEDKKAAMYF